MAVLIIVQVVIVVFVKICVTDLFFFSLHLPNSKETFFSTIVASENIAIALYLPSSRLRTSYVEDRTIDVRTFPFPEDI